MASDEQIGGVVIPITSDWSDLDKSMDAALSDATQKSQAIASAITSALGNIQPPDFSGVIEAINGTTAAVQQISAQIETLKKDFKDANDSANETAGSIKALADTFTQLAAAFAFTEGMREFGLAAIEAADHVDDATQAIGRFAGGTEAAQATIAQLRGVASDEALGFPQLLVASQRMTAFLGDSSKVPDIMRAAGDAAAVMGTNVETASKSIERFAAGGDLSAKSLKNLGLTMGDMAAVLGTTSDNAKAAFAALDQAGKIDAVVAALGKFNGAAKEMNDDALGALVRLGQSWSQVLEEIGKALDPVIKALADFAKSNIVEPIRDMVASFNQLPAPVKEFAVAIGIAAAAIVPIAAGIAGVLAVIGPLEAALAGAGTAIAGVAEVIGGALAVSLSEVLIPIAAVGAAIAILHFTGLGDDIMEFLQGPLEALKIAFTTAAEVVTKEFSDLGANVKDTFDSLGGLLKDVGGLVEDVAKNAFGPLVDVLKDLAGQLGITTPEVTSFKDAVKLALDLTAPVAGLKALNAELGALKSGIDLVRPVVQLLSADMALMKGATADATSALKLQQDLAAQNAHLLADQAMGLNAVTTSSNAYAQGLKAIQEQQAKLNDAVTAAKGVLDAARDAQDGTTKSAQDLARAQAEYEKAVTAANAQTAASKQAHQDAAAAAKEHAAEIKTLNEALNEANTVLGTVADSYDKYIQDLQNGGKTATQQISDINKAIDDLSKKMLTLKDPALIAGIQDWIGKLNDAKKTLQDFAAEDAWNKLSGQIAGLAAKFPQQVGEMTGSLKDFVQQALTTAETVPAAMNKIDIAGLVGKWLEAQKQLDDQTVKMKDHFDKVYEKYINDTQTRVIPITADLRERLANVDTTLQGIAADSSQLWNTSAIGNYLAMVKEMNAEGYKTVQQEQAQIQAEKDLLTAMENSNQPLGERLDLEGKILAADIKLAEQVGADASKQIYALESVRLKQEVLIDQTHGMADAYVAMFKDINAGFAQMEQAMADAIVNGKNLGDALIGVFKKIATSILDDLIKGALKPLEDELKKAEADLLGMLGGGGGSNPAAGAAGAAASGVTPPATAGGSGTGSGNTGGALGSGLGGVDTATGIISAGAAVASTVLLGHISSDTGHIEVNTRETHAELLNVRKDDWDQFNQTYDRIGEIMNALYTVRDTLIQMKEAGMGGVFPDSVINDLHDINAHTQTEALAMPTIIGALGTIATDLVTGIQEIEANYLAVIVQKLGELVTNEATGMGNLASASDLMSAADEVAKAADGTTDAVKDTTDAVDSSSSDITGALGDLTSTTGSGMTAMAAVITGGIIDSGNKSDNITIDAANKQLGIAQAQYAAATFLDKQITALRAEYDADTRLMNAAIAQAAKETTQAAAQADLALAEQYRQAAANVQSQLLPLLSDTAVYTGDAADTLGRMNSTLGKDITGVGMAATNAGTLISAHVDAAAVSIGTAVSQAVAAVGFSSKGNQSTGGGTTTSADYSAGQKNTGQATGAPTAGTGVPTGTQPGFSPTNLPSSNGIPTPTGTPTQTPGGNPSSPLGYQPAPSGAGASDQGSSSGKINPGVIPPPPDVSATNPYGNGLPPLKGGPAVPGGSTGTDKIAELQQQLLNAQNQLADDMKKIADATAGGASKDIIAALQSAAQKDLLSINQIKDAITKASETASTDMESLQQQLLNAQNQLADDLKKLSDATASGQSKDVIAALQAAAQQDALAINQIKDQIAKGSDSGTAPSGLQSGLATHPGLVGQPIGTGITPASGAPSDSSLKLQDIQSQMDLVQSELQKAQAALLAAQNQQNAPGGMGNPDIIKQEEMLNQQIQLLTQKMADLQKSYSDAGGVTSSNNFGSIGSIKNAPYPTSSSAGSSPSSPGGTLDPQTLGFYAGALAELEDIRNTIHGEKDLVSSMRDSWVAFQVTAHNDAMVVGQAIITALGSTDKIPKFHDGGDVGHDMVGMLKAGEHVIPSDISGMLRQMVRTPSYSQVMSPSYDNAKQVPKQVNINMPVTVNNARDGRQLAMDLTRHIKHMTSDAGAYSD